MKVCFRTDASTNMGTGHVLRCLTLADQLRHIDAEISFICRQMPGNMIEYIKEKGFSVHLLQPNAADHSMNPEFDARYTLEILQEQGLIDWLIVDHYSLDCQWENQMRPYTLRIMVIDDLANRAHDCDLLLDQNLFSNLEIRYDSLVSSHCLKLLGPKYALLRPEFREARHRLRERKGKVERILLFFGGSDPTNETEKALKAIQLLNRSDLFVDVVVGHANPHRNKIEQLCSQHHHLHYHCQIKNMAELMTQADFSIGAGGSTTWERCYLGLPAITVVVAENQLETTMAVAGTGAILNLGWHEQVKAHDLSQGIDCLLEDSTNLNLMSANAVELMGDRTHISQDVVVNKMLQLMGENL
jgi:UDP-2,4-diacetamido-2,4,6-trideoxy-beta-L-altropyranose hydrolase